MKKSLFMRAFAAVSAVPVALTQCLAVANAISVKDTALSVTEESNVALQLTDNIKLTGDNGLLYIEPQGNYFEDEVVPGYVLQEDGTFVTYSNWDAVVSQMINNVKPEGVVDTTAAFENIVKQAQKVQGGIHVETLKACLEKVGEVTYKIADGKITVTAPVDDLSDVILGDTMEGFGKGLNKVADKYGIPELKDKTPYEGIEIAGTATIVVDINKLASNGEVSVQASFTANDGTVYNGLKAVDYVVAQVKAIEDAVKAEIKKYESVLDLNDAFNTVDKDMERWLGYVEDAKTYLTKVLSYSGVTTGDNVQEVVEKIQSRLEETKLASFRYYKNNKDKIPTSGSEAADSKYTDRVYNSLVNFIAKNGNGYTIDFTADELGAFVDSLYSIVVDTAEGTSNITAKYADDEAAEVATYFAGKGYEVSESYKQFEIEADYANIADGTASASLTYKRIVVAETTATTTSTTQTTQTTVTTVTGSDTDTDTDTNTETGTVTTVTGSDTETATGTETTATGSDTETTTATTTDNVENGTRVVVTTAVNVRVESTPGFYINYATEFNKDQIIKVFYSIDEMKLIYDAVDGTFLGSEVITKGDNEVDLMGIVSFGDATPANTVVENNNSFAYQVALIATQDIVDGDITIAKAGEPIKLVSGANASVTAYIGVRGDANLDNKVDAGDASDVLTYYANIQTGEKPEETWFATNSVALKLVKENGGNPAEEILDDFAAFLADVTSDTLADADNWKRVKAERSIQADDASSILSHYALLSTMEEGTVDGKEIWDKTPGAYLN